MNKDQVKGRIKEAAGETQEQFGKLVNSKEQEAKSHAREHAGKAQKAAGDLREQARDDAKAAFRKP